MKPTILPLALAVMLAAGMCGCADSQRTIESRKDLNEYYEAAARRMDRRQNEQFARILKAYIDCTNHAPVVVTNECKYCAWARERAGPWPTNHLRTPFTIELQDQTGGTHRITFPTNWFSTPIPVLYGRVYVTNAVEK